MYSRFILAMFSREIPLGHSISQAPVFVQFPKPSLSICSTIANTREVASTFPCGSKANWLTLAAVNNMALAFLHAATQAPHEIQEAEKKAASASSFGIGMEFASWVIPEVLTDTY